MLSFSEINTTSFGIDPSPEGAKRFLKSTTTQFSDLVDRGVRRWRMTPQYASTFDAIVGRSRHIQNHLGSNMDLRFLLGSRLIDLLHDMEKLLPQRRFFLVTLLSDRWLSFDRYTQIWLGGMKDAMRQVLRLGGFTGWFGMVEVQTLDETVRYFGRILLPHGHFVVWSDDLDFDPLDAENRMAASGRLESRTSAKTVTVRADRSTSACNIAAYVMKAAALAKYRVPAHRSPSRFGLADCALPDVTPVSSSTWN